MMSRGIQMIKKNYFFLKVRVKIKKSMSLEEEEEEEEEPTLLDRIYHTNGDDGRKCDKCDKILTKYYESLYDNATKTFLCSSCEPQEIIITLRFTRALFHEGGGTSHNACRGCGGSYKRYYRLCLIDGNNAFMCRDCFAGEQTGYDDSYDSEPYSD
jgi:hypothetical protein